MDEVEDKKPLELSDFDESAGSLMRADGDIERDLSSKEARDLEAVFDIPVKVTAVLGRTKLEISRLLELGAGSVVELDRKVGEAIDIYVNTRLIARGEVVLVEDRLGITVTEIIKTEKEG